MQRYFNYVTNRQGDAIEGASVAVTLASTGSTPTIYSDEGITAKTNPLTTDGNGLFSFYAPDGKYNLEISGTSITTQNILDVELNDSAIVSVKNYGATGDGSTDDSSAIQAALTAVIAKKVAALFFPAGDYLLSSAVTGTLTDWSEIAIYGEGKHATKLVVNNTTGGIILTCATRRSPVSIKEMSVVSKVVNGGTGFQYEVTNPGGAQRRHIFEANNINIGSHDDTGVEDYAFAKHLVAKVYIDL